MTTCQIDKDMTVVPGRVWPLSSVMPPLAPLPTAPACARAFVSLTLSVWGMAGLAEPAGLVTSELVTNAVQASSPYDRDSRAGAIRVCVFADPAQILIEVHDEAAGVPRLHTPGELDEDGRGLMLVEAIAGRWGWRPAGRRGKCVWAGLPRLATACKLTTACKQCTFYRWKECVDAVPHTRQRPPVCARPGLTAGRHRAGS